MNPEILAKAVALTKRKELLESLKEGFGDGSAFAPGVKAATGAAFGKLANTCRLIVDEVIKSVSEEIDAL